MVIRAVVFLLLMFNPAGANPLCAVSGEKREIINKLLCGQFAKEAEYRFGGPACYRSSATKRLEDSALHVVIFRVCGEPDFAEKLRLAHLQAFSFMKNLAVCAEREFDIEKAFDVILQSTESKFRNLGCQADMRSSISRRRPYFERMIEIASSRNMAQEVFKKLGIRVSSDGKIVDNQ
ncbi:MAG: hypothetical protein AB7F96_21270 [Beijerinckiaceae bacterium]